MSSFNLVDIHKILLVIKRIQIIRPLNLKKKNFKIKSKVQMKILVHYFAKVITNKIS